jgi:simple sugar transport system permease protein
VGVLIFGFLSNILQLNNIDSNTQLVLKGGIILAAVLVQERSLGDLFSLRRIVGARARPDPAPPRRPAPAQGQEPAAEARLADHP